MKILPLLLAALLGASDEDAEPAGILTRAPELVAFVPAEYPPDAAAAGIEGAVVLSIVVGEDGAVQQAVVQDPGPHPAFAAAALHAVSQFRFHAAEIDGVPAAVEITYRYEFVLQRAPPPAVASGAGPVVLSGRIVERGTRDPIAGVALDAGGVTATTDARGRFAFRGLPPGPVAVRIVSPEHEALSLEETIRDGKVVEVEYRLTRRHYDPYEAVVRGGRDRREVSVHTLALEEVRTVPGTQGDVLKVLQNLPGVARSPFGIGLLVVRGSEPTDTSVYLDGISVPLLFHFGGVTSVVSSDVVDKIDFFPGNFGARFGRALAGTVDVRTREPQEGFHGAAQLDIFDGRAEVEGPVGDGRAFVSIRRSWVDAVLAAVLPRAAPDAADDLRVAPRYYDYQAKLTLPLLGGIASVLAYGSDDKLEFVRDSERSGRPTFYLSTVFHRLGVRWQRAFGDVSNDLVLALGRDSFDVLQSSNFGVLSEFGSVTFRDGLVWRPSDDFALELGVDAILRSFEYSVYAPPSTAPGTVGGPLDTAETTVGERADGLWLSPAAYGEVDWRVLPPLRLVAGLRVEGDSRLRHDRTWVDPRVSLFYDVAAGTTLTAAAGLFGKAPDPEEMTDTFGNRDLGPERALHLSLGVRQALPWASRVELTGFYKELWALAVRTRALDDQGRLLHLRSTGRGEALGLEVLLRRELARGLFGWLSYTWSRSLRRDDPTSPSFPAWHVFGLDQTHILALVASYRLPGDWILGTRVRAVSGNPYTPAEGYVLDADSGHYECLGSGAALSRRLPGFFQADARVDKRFVFEDWMLSVYMDVQNVTNRENAEFRIQRYDCADFVPFPSVPIFPAVGLRAEW
jgi:TonB family protein